MGTLTIASPTGKRNPGATRSFEAAIAAAVLLISLLYARYALGTVFRPFDDEGCMLLSLRSYLAGHRLYTETYTQYGPFLFYFQSFWFWLLNLPVTHDSGRLLTFLTWVASAMLTGVFAHRVSRNLLLASSACACCIVLGTVLASEPGHPQQIVLALLTLSAVVTTWLARRASLSLALLAAIGGALLFTKVNIGAFYLVALAHTYAVLLTRGRTRSAVMAFTTVGATALPYLLMRSNPEGIGGYFISSTLCIGVTFACATQLRPKSPIPWRGILWAVVGGTLAVAVIVIAAAWKGISLVALINGVLITPAKQPHAFALPYYVSFATLCFTLLVLACAGMLASYAAQGRLAAHCDRIEALRCLIGLGMVAAILFDRRFSDPHATPQLGGALSAVGSGHAQRKTVVAGDISAAFSSLSRRHAVSRTISGCGQPGVDRSVSYIALWITVHRRWCRRPDGLIPQIRRTWRGRLAALGSGVPFGTRGQRDVAAETAATILPVPRLAPEWRRVATPCARGGSPI